MPPLPIRSGLPTVTGRKSQHNGPDQDEFDTDCRGEPLVKPGAKSLPHTTGETLRAGVDRVDTPRCGVLPYAFQERTVIAVFDSMIFGRRQPLRSYRSAQLGRTAPGRPSDAARRLSPGLDIGPCPDHRLLQLGDGLREGGVSAAPRVDRLGMRKAKSLGDLGGAY